MTATQFVSALELATYFNGTTELGDLTADWIAQADLLLQMISADIEDAAGVRIEASRRTVLLAGTWARDLELPGGVIRDVHAVTVNGVALEAAGWTWNDRRLLRRGATFGGIANADDPAGLSWGGPATTIAVELSDGLTVVPEIVRALTFRIAARTFGNVSDITQESLAIYSVTYTQSRNGADGSHVRAAERSRLRRCFNRTGGTIVATG